MGADHCDFGPARLARGFVGGRMRPLKRLLLAMSAALLASSAIGCQGVVAQSKNAEGAKFFAQGNLEAARKRFLDAVAAHPMDPDGYYNLAALTHYQGRQSHNLNDLAQAEQLYNQCLDRAPDHVACHRGLAVLLVEEGRKDKAFTLLQRWGQRSPQLADARVELARMYDEFGEKDAAKQSLQDALTLDPKNARALAALGHVHERQGDYAQALAVYQRSLQSNARQPELAQRVAALQRGAAPPAAAPPAGVPPSGAPAAAPASPPTGVPAPSAPPASGEPEKSRIVAVPGPARS